MSARLLTKADRKFFISEALYESKSSTDTRMRMYWPDSVCVCRKVRKICLLRRALETGKQKMVFETGLFLAHDEALSTQLY